MVTLSKSRDRSSALRLRAVIQYIAAMAVVPLVLTGVAAAAYFLLSRYTWQPGVMWSLISFLWNNLPIVYIVVLALSWIVITFIFLMRPYRYIDEIVSASEQLTKTESEPIVLPGPLNAVQDRMNLLREESARNAAAAREAEQRKNDLIVYLAHDLKTPLTSVIGYLTLLRDEPDISPELKAKYTGIAAEKAMRLESLINEFFDITRFSLSNIELEPEEVNFSMMLEQIMSEFEPILAGKNLTWQPELAPGVRLICDTDKMERVIDNLIRNAVNYSYPSTSIYVSLKNLSGRVELKIRNRGRTISADKLERIFDQFFRADSARGSATGGSGLGLAIARQIVELHGGRIWAESADETVTFTVVMPVM